MYMHSFKDPFGFDLEKSQLSKLDFPFYLALACILIDRLCNGNVTYLSNLNL